MKPVQLQNIRYDFLDSKTVFLLRNRVIAGGVQNLGWEICAPIFPQRQGGGTYAHHSYTNFSCQIPCLVLWASTLSSYINSDCKHWTSTISSGEGWRWDICSKKWGTVSFTIIFYLRIISHNVEKYHSPHPETTDSLFLAPQVL